MWRATTGIRLAGWAGTRFYTKPLKAKGPAAKAADLAVKAAGPAAKATGPAAKAAVPAAAAITSVAPGASVPEWKKRAIATKARYGAWNPTHKLLRDQMANVRLLKEQAPSMTTADLAGHFGVSPEAIRRILRSKWGPSEAAAERMDRRAAERKQQSVAQRSALSDDIQRARARMSYGKSIELADLDRAATVKSFKRDGKVLYDSSVSHSFYKNPKRRDRPRKPRRPFADSVADIID